MSTSSQVLQCVATPNSVLTTIPISHSPSLPPASKTLTVASVPSALQSEAHPRADPGTLPEEVLRLQREMNAAMGQLLATRASMDSHQRRLVSNTKTALYQNEAKTAVAIKEAKAHCAATIREAEAAEVDHAHTLQQSLRESMQDLECEVIEKEGWDTKSFLEACRVGLQACLQLATAIGKPTPTTPHPTMSDIHTSNGDQTVMLFIQQGGSLSEIRGGRSHGVRHDPRGVAPL